MSENAPVPLRHLSECLFLIFVSLPSEPIHKHRENVSNLLNDRLDSFGKRCDASKLPPEHKFVFVPAPVG
jgi:hypothetical protein